MKIIPTYYISMSISNHYLPITTLCYIDSLDCQTLIAQKNSLPPRVTSQSYLSELLPFTGTSGPHVFIKDYPPFCKFNFVDHDWPFGIIWRSKRESKTNFKKKKLEVEIMDERQNVLQLFTDDYQITPPISPSKTNLQKDNSHSVGISDIPLPKNPSSSLSHHGSTQYRRVSPSRFLVEAQPSPNVFLGADPFKKQIPTYSARTFGIPEATVSKKSWWNYRRPWRGFRPSNWRED